MTSVSPSFGSFFTRTMTQMNGLRRQIDQAQTQIATGARIARGSQDPAAAAALRVLDRRARLGEAASANAAQLGLELGLADRELQGVTAVLQRARELAVAAGNSPLSASGRDAIAAELAQLEQELFTRANATTPDGNPLFAGDAAGPAFTRTASGSVIYSGSAAAPMVTLAPGTTIARGLPGAQIFSFTQGGVPTSAFAILGGLSAALGSSAGDPAAAARDAIAGLDSALDTIGRAQTILGTRAVWVDMIQAEQQGRAVDLAERRSEIGDTQISEAIIRLQQAMTALEASQSAFARISSLSLFRALS